MTNSSAVGKTTQSRGNRAVFSIREVHQEDLPTLADFLAQRVNEEAPDEVLAQTDRSGSGFMSRLRWRLLQNPARSAYPGLGECIRAQDGRILGVHLQHPAWFFLGERRLLGLCSGDFFVAPAARMQGFFLFRRFLNARGVDFFYASSCNLRSSRLWKAVRGEMVPDSRYTWLVPLRWPSIAERFVLNRGAGAVAAKLVRISAGLVSPVLALGRPRSSLRTYSCRDWEKLAALAEQHRRPDVLTPERSSQTLRWKFEQNTGDNPIEVVCFENSRGTTGWYAVRCKNTAGSRLPIVSCQIVDVVIPEETIHADEVLAAVIKRQSAYAHEFILTGWAATWGPHEGFFVRRRVCEAPRAWILASDKVEPPLAKLYEPLLAAGDAF